MSLNILNLLEVSWPGNGMIKIGNKSMIESGGEMIEELEFYFMKNGKEHLRMVGSIRKE